MACLLALVAAALGLTLQATPARWIIEERLALDWMFRLRGPLPPPSDVAVVSLDRQSGERLGLPAKLRDWPRTVHARLIDRLTEAGASVIAFDVIFETPRTDPAQDRALAQAIRRSGRVVLLEMVDRVSRAVTLGGSAGVATSQAIVPPLPLFSEEAVGLGPFPLPHAKERVSHFWAFMPLMHPKPTLPVVALGVHAEATGPDLRRFVDTVLGADGAGGIEVVHHVDDRLAALRTRLLSGPRPTPAAFAQLQHDLPGVSPDRARALAALLTLHAGPDARFLNFYGPAGRVLTVPAADVLDDTRYPELKARLAGRAVFVGLSELLAPHEDTFKTVYSQSDGIDLAGVEIAATAFANLLEDRTLQPVTAGVTLAILIGFAVVLALPAVLLPVRYGVPVVLGLALAYAGSAQYAFVGHATWLPLGIPLLVQLPVCVLGGLWLQYRTSHRRAENLTSGIRYYLPADVTARLATSADTAKEEARLVHAISMVSDAEGFTSIAEGVAPVALKEALDRYFDQVFSEIGGRGGLITDIVGDGVTAVWLAPADDVDARARACQAALAIDRLGLDGTPHPQLTTRIGLNPGDVVLGSVGGSGRLAYSVVGDAVNTASRIERLNKHLGTRVLASTDTVRGLDDHIFRPLGRFRLFGKKESLPIVELLHDPPDRPLPPWRMRFADALAAFQVGAIPEARDGFAGVLAERPKDGPSRFFMTLCDPSLPRQRAATVDEFGTVRLHEK